MNEDESTFEIPDYIQSRLQPTLTLAHPSREDELAILRYHLPFSDAEMLNLTVEFLQNSHKLKLDFSSRDGINVLRYALKRIAQDPKHPLGKDQAWRESLSNCLGEEALDLNSLAERKARTARRQRGADGAGRLLLLPRRSAQSRLRGRR